MPNTSHRAAKCRDLLSISLWILGAILIPCAIVAAVFAIVELVWLVTR